MTPAQATGLAKDLTWLLGVLAKNGTTTPMTATEYGNAVSDLKAAIAALGTVSGSSSSSSSGSGASSSSSGSLPPPVTLTPPVLPGPVFVVPDSIKILQGLDNGVPVLGSSFSFPSDWLSKNGVWDGATKTVTLKGSQNETLAFQIVIANSGTAPIDGVSVMVGTTNVPVELALVGYVPVPSPSDATMAPVPALGNWPDYLIPFIDPYSGKTVVSTFDVQPGTTQAVWVRIPIPKGFMSGTYPISIQVGTRETVSVSLTVSGLDLPGFNGDPSMVKAFMPIYASRLVSGEGFPSGTAQSLPASFQALVQTYQKVAREYGFDTWLDGVMPVIKVDATANTATIDWTLWDELNGPALSGTLFADGQPIRVINLFTESWNALDAYGWSYTADTLPPTGLMALLQNVSEQISAHFKANGWMAMPLAYIFDEPHGKIGATPNLYAIIGSYADAINAANAASGSNPILFFLTEAPQPMGEPAASLPSLAALTGKVNGWAPTSEYYEPPVMNALQPVNGVIENWSYQNHPPFLGGSNLNNEATDLRLWFWIAEKYGLSGLFVWALNFWGTPSIASTPTDAATSPYLQSTGYNASQPSDGVLFYPGAQLPLVGFPAISGPVPSIRAEMWRRSCQDYQYLRLLAQTNPVEAASIRDSLVTRALNAGYNPPWSDPLWTKPGDWSHDPDAIDQARLAMISALGG